LYAFVPLSGWFVGVILYYQFETTTKQIKNMKAQALALNNGNTQELTIVKSFLVLLFALIAHITFGQLRPYAGQDDPQVFTEIRPFLKALNTSNGKPLEQLSPTDARQVLLELKNQFR
jgi:hypothetical protein